MNAGFRRCLTELMPPLALRCGRAAVRRLRALSGLRPAHTYGTPESAAEEDEEYRARRDFFQAHYTESPYYFLWCVVADRLVRQPRSPVLEIGCGAGQFARLLHDKRIEDYIGIDFSKEAIGIAQSFCPTYTFLLLGVCETDALLALDYQTVVALEVVEHLPEDVELLRRIRPGTRVLASVPSFPSISHIRYFSGCGEVACRYAALFDDFRADSLPLPGNTARFFLFEGIRRQDP